MTERATLALLVAKPGPLRHSLRALLATMPQIEILAETADPSALLRMGTELQPDVIVLDVGLNEEAVWDALGRIRDEWSRTSSIVLAEDSQQQQRALDAGAKVALVRGYPADKLMAAIEGLLPRGQGGTTHAASRKD